MDSNFRLLIFDCDGVLVDSEKYSCGAWNHLLKDMFQIEVGTNYDVILGKSDHAAVLYYAGLNPVIKKWLTQDGNEEEKIRELSKRKLETYYKIANGNLKQFAGLRGVIKQARDLHWPIVVGSSGVHEKIRWNLKQVNLENEFDDITSSQDVKRGKPFPDLFLEAAKKMKIPAEESIVIEDSITGLQAAREAHCYAIGITTTYTRDKLLPYADLVIDSFAELDLKSLRRAT